MGEREIVRTIEEYSGFRKCRKTSVWIYRLEADYTYQSGREAEFLESKWLRIETSGSITVKAGYAWNGCSPKLNVLDLCVLGTPDGIVNVKTMKPKAYYASLVHDALYQYYSYHSLSRGEADRIFRDILRRDRFLLGPVYYCFVRALGWLGLLGRKKAVGSFEFS